MITFATVVGLAAAVCTTAANVPQLKKAWTTGQTDDISMNMLLVLASGLALWVTYGVLQKDLVIILANAISLALIGGLLLLEVAAGFLLRAPGQRRRKTSSWGYELCFCGHVSLKRGPATIEAHSMTTETCRYRGYDIVPDRQWSQWCVSIYTTRADLPLFSQPILRTLAFGKEEAVAEAKQSIDRLLQS